MRIERDDVSKLFARGLMAGGLALGLTTVPIQAEGELQPQTISIKGGPLFIQRVNWAMGWLDRIEEGDFVRQNLDGVRECPEIQAYGIPLGALGRDEDGSLIAVLVYAPANLHILSEVLAHEALHAKSFSEGLEFDGPEGEREADKVQQRVADKLADLTFSPSRQVKRTPEEIAKSPRANSQFMSLIASCFGRY